MKKIILAAALTAISAGAVHASDVYTCERTNLSTTGFTNFQAAASWFPEEVRIVISDDKSSFSSTWGTDNDRSDTEKRINSANVSGFGAQISVRIFDNGKSNENIKMSAALAPKGGFKHVYPSYYSCDRH